MPTIDMLDRVRATQGGALPLRQIESGRTQEGARSFADTLKEVVQDVNRQQVASGDTALRFMAGEVEHVHEAMIAMQKARTSFEFLVEVRNKLLDGYKEVMRMQV